MQELSKQKFKNFMQFEGLFQALEFEKKSRNLRKKLKKQAFCYLNCQLTETDVGEEKIVV